MNYVSPCTLDVFVLIRNQNALLVCSYNTLKNVRHRASAMVLLRP